jgi:hypothetical protein
VDKLALIAKRRPYERPAARSARLALERRLMKPRMRVLFLRAPEELIAALDEERRRYYDRIPARNEVARELLTEALAIRRIGRPRESGPAPGKTPFIFKS